MAAPDPTFLAAVRAGTVARHIFFKMTHTSGTVYAWDGIGEFTYGGNTYTGVRGFVSLSGVSESYDVQEPAIEVVINAVPYSALREAGVKVRGETLDIYAVWINYASGAVVASKTLFNGVADQMRVIPNGADLAIKVLARAKLSGWHVTPNVYYLNRDQQRYYANDVGFSLVPSLENSNVAGWANTPETSGGRPVLGGYRMGLYDNVDGNLIGHHTNGMNASRYGTGALTIHYVNGLTADVSYAVEDTTGAYTDVNLSQTLKVGGVECYVDASGDVRTAGGNYVVPYYAGGSANRYRRQADIASVGDATSELIVPIQLSEDEGMFPLMDKTPFGSAVNNFLRRDSATPSGYNFAPFVYDNARGHSHYSLADDAFGYVRDLDTSGLYVGDSGNPVRIISGYLTSEGGYCTISTTGAVRTPGGNFVTLSDGSSQNFLRVWV